MGWQTLQGELLQMADDERGGRGLIKLDKPIDYLGSSWRYIVFSPRHNEDEVAELHNGKNVFATFIGISEQQALLGHRAALDTSKWRGGLGFIGEVEPIKSIAL
jgi:hypothetical protein